MSKKVFIKTFGCQMNDRDSEEIAGMLLEKGYSFAGSPEEADVVIFNTCSVRKHAEDRAISNVGALKALKKKRPEIIIGVVGCMAKAEGDKIIEKLPHVDFISAPANIYEIPEIIERLSDRNAPHLCPLPSGERSKFTAGVKGKILAVDRESRPEIKNIAYHKKGVSALVTIMEGCNNFCSYCIVPYVRGREVSRPMNSIIDEIKVLADNGYKEITLLGQNVNSYKETADSVFSGQRSADSVQKGLNAERYTLNAEKCNFITLLESINGIDGIERIRFLTSHPKDAGEDLFRAMRDLPKICEHLHLPLQSGSDRILKSMNRGYTTETYLGKIEMLREYVPDCAITTDVIVGYPGETEEDFKATESLIRKIGFNFAFVFKYSPRLPAQAGKLEDDVSKRVKEERNRILLSLQDKISTGKEKEFIGKETEVLVEGECRKETGKVVGRNRQNIKVVFPVPASSDGLIGKLKKVKVKSILGHTLVGAAMLFMFLANGAACNTAKAETTEAVEGYFVSGDYENAVREGVKLLATSREKDKVFYIIGTSLNKMGRYDLARKNFGPLIETFPGSDFAPLAQLGIADSYYLGGDYRNAVSEYEKYITRYPKSPGSATAYFRIAKCAQKEGRWQGARNYYQKVKSDFPASFEAEMASQALSEETLYFTVQVGSFNKKVNALKLCDELVKKGYDASIVKAEGEGAESYKVRAGKLDTLEEAKDLAKRLHAEGLPTKVLP